MDRDERRNAIRNRIQEQIEVVARAICEGKDASGPERVLKALETQLAREEISRKA